jgi:hypothetical protein
MSSRAYVKSYKRKSRSATKKKPSAMRAQKMAAVRQVANLRSGGYTGLELKYFDTRASYNLVADAAMTGGECDPATVNCLNAMIVGNSANQRDGRQITMKNVYVSGQLVDHDGAAVTGAGASRLVYVALVLDTQTNGAQLRSQDVYELATGSSAAQCVNPLRNLQYSKRFRVLDSMTCEIRPHNVFDGTNPTHIYGSQPFKLSSKLNHVVNFTGDGGTVGAISDNSLHIIAFSDDSNKIALTYEARVRFVG